MTGPGKRDDELPRRSRPGVGAITVESPGELAASRRSPPALGRRQPVLLRLAVGGRRRLEQRPAHRRRGAASSAWPRRTLRMRPRRGRRVAAPGAAGHPRLRRLERARRRAPGRPRRPRPWPLAERSRRRRACRSGWWTRAAASGIPYADGERPLDLAALGRRLAALAGAWAADPATCATRVLLEPGRFLVGPAGAYVARVVDVKGAGEAPVAILDGGIHHLLRPALVGQAQRRPARARRRGRRSASAGSGSRSRSRGRSAPASTSSPQRRAHGPARGRRPAWRSWTRAPTASPSRCRSSCPTRCPAEVAVRGGRAALIRPRLEPSDWLDRQLTPAW